LAVSALTVKDVDASLRDLLRMSQVTRTESYFHMKYDPRERGAGGGDQTGANVGQNIF
jgi:CRISPR-associated protein Cst2